LINLLNLIWKLNKLNTLANLQNRSKSNHTESCHVIDGTKEFSAQDFLP
jgi:hypothetical protein